MDFFEKVDYNIDDIIALIDNDAEESVHLDFKAAGALSKDDKKKTEIAKMYLHLLILMVVLLCME